jgi:uncharacterized protein
MRFEWDPVKNRANLQKHKVRFETARSIFDDEYTMSVRDRAVEGEERWLTLGMIDGVVLIVAHTWTAEEGGDETIRIISARKATPRERQAYAKNQQRPN